MADPTRIRLVRCPKCGNLLPELEDYSVFQCGGCGAVLRAKNKNSEAETLYEKPEEEIVGDVSTKSLSSLEKTIADLSDTSDTDKSSAGSLKCDQRVVTEKKEAFGLGVGGIKKAKGSSNQFAAEDSVDVKVVGEEVANETVREDRELRSKVRHTAGSGRSRQMSDWQSRGGVQGFPRNARSDTGRLRYSTSNYSDEGPSNYHSDSAHVYREALRTRIGPDAANRVRYPEQDRSELLRKLDELKEQLTRSCDVVDKSTEKVPLDGRIAPPDPYAGSDSWLPNHSLRSHRASMPFSGPGNHVAGPSYSNHFPDQFPSKYDTEMHMHGLHPAMHKLSHVPHGDPFRSQVLRGAPPGLPTRYQQPSHPYFAGQSVDRSNDLCEPYQHNAMLHQPYCSCYYCFDKHHPVSAPAQPCAHSNKTNNSMFYHHENPGAFGRKVNNHTAAAVPPPILYGPQSQTRWPSDLNSEMGDFVRYRPRRVVLTSSGRHCRPIAGGSPFIICNNCFELLQLPRKTKLMAKNLKRLQCGSCYTIIDFDIINKQLVVSPQAESLGISTVVHVGSNEAVKDYILGSHGRLDRINATFSSDDYDNSGYDFQALDREPVASIDRFQSSGKPQEMHSSHSSSPSTSEDEHSPEVVLAPREVTYATQETNKATQPTTPTGSQRHEHFDHTSNNRVVNRYGKGNRSNRSDQEQVIPNKVTARQTSLKVPSLATEMEVPLNEYSNAGMSEDSGNTRREDDLPRNNRTSKSFFANVIKKSFKDLSRSNQTQEQGKSNVSVNGHFIPDHLVKKAEKLAGPIHPGHYWYDSRAGFWGIMGGPCLGIIPPFIEELDYPMPENCAGGNTGVFVNGRELHQKDSDLLSSRGLPTSQDRSYIVEISGRVFDEDTGEELDSLGKLAPTVEKAKHGFGMKVPRLAA